MQKPYKSLQVFKNPFLERLTHVHPITPLVLWLPITVWFIWHSVVEFQLNFYQMASMGVAGFTFWTWVEYILHRFVFHYDADSRIGQRIHFLIHGLHHSDPIDPTRLVMPPTASIFLAVILYTAFRCILGPIWVEPFFGFFLLGYLCYDYIHFSVHHFKPRTRLGKFLKQSHMQHHYVSPNSRWGVSSPIWDYVFGTLEDVNAKKERTV